MDHSMHQGRPTGAALTRLFVTAFVRLQPSPTGAEPVLSERADRHPSDVRLEPLHGRTVEVT
jgi:hypothetical protein